MAKKFKKILALALVVSMLASMMVMTVQAEEGAEDSKYTVALIPGQTTNAVKTVSDAGGDTIYTITAVTSAV